MREEALTFGETTNLSGVYTPPAVEGTGRPGVLLLNSGIVHHVGPNRLYVRLARVLAHKGHPVLRFDFSGIGDSEKSRDNVRFEVSAVAETRQAMNALAERSGMDEFGLIGICSGAEISFKTALVDERVTGAVLINAPQYKEEPSAELLDAIARRQESHYYWRVALFNRKSWLKLLRGAEYRAIVRVLGSKVREKFLPRKRSPVQMSPQVSADIAAFQQLTDREVRLLLLFSEVDWGWDYLHAVMGPQVREWEQQGNPRLATVKRADHMMTPLVSQDRTQNLVLDWASRLPTREEFVL